VEHNVHFGANRDLFADAKVLGGYAFAKFRGRDAPFLLILAV
jgi:hypothetical protein